MKKHKSGDPRNRAIKKAYSKNLQKLKDYRLLPERKWEVTSGDLVLWDWWKNIDGKIGVNFPDKHELETKGILESTLYHSILYEHALLIAKKWHDDTDIEPSPDGIKISQNHLISHHVMEWLDDVREDAMKFGYKLPEPLI
jgi:hypothetical protein